MHIPNTVRRTVVAAVVAATALTTALLPSTGAVAATSAGQTFSAQARAAHLSQAQTTALQAEVDRYVQQSGGRQVSLNKIDLNGTGTILVALPGEAHPRDFTAADATTLAADPCFGAKRNNGWFCAYSKSYFQGTRIDMFKCAALYSVSQFSSGGSWINNQTVGQEARMYDRNFKLVYTTPGAHSYDLTGNWANVDYVQPC